MQVRTMMNESEIQSAILKTLTMTGHIPMEFGGNSRKIVKFATDLAENWSLCVQTEDYTGQTLDMSKFVMWSGLVDSGLIPPGMTDEETLEVANFTRIFWVFWKGWMNENHPVRLTWDDLGPIPN